jgi:thioredoxin reductase (NADPH)
MTENLLTFLVYGICAIAIVIPFLVYQKKLKERESRALESEAKGKTYSSGPQSQHPHIDNAWCIGCAICTHVCPEGDVLAMLGGKAVLVNGYKCIGHSLCADACPVGAITMVMASPSMSADLPYLTPEFETSIPNMFIVGELGGMALIKHAINQGRDCVDNIGNRVKAMGTARSVPGVVDVLVVGAGPGGVSASLRAIENKLTYMTLEQDEEIGGTVAKYPRQKLVMTSPVNFPMYGKFNKMQLSKEELLAFWHKVRERTDFKVHTGEKVGEIKKELDGIFTVVTTKGQYRSHAVVLALGKAGTPLKLGVKGEELGKVMYRLIEADHYINKNILIVGGGDSAVEAAMGLASQVGNKVTLSYRKDSFSRIKERNTQRVNEFVRTAKMRVVFNSSPVEFKQDSVLLDVQGKMEEIPNDFIWIFAGGVPPTAFLKKIGIAFGIRDVTLETSKEAKQIAISKKELVQTPELAVS